MRQPGRMTGLSKTQVQTLAIDPNTPTTVYAGTHDGGVFKSIDSGATWTATNTGLPSIFWVNSLAIDPITPTIVYAGTWWGGVFKSTDGGAHWTANYDYDNFVSTLAIDPKNPAIVYAGRDTGVFKSTG